MRPSAAIGWMAVLLGMAALLAFALALVQARSPADTSMPESAIIFGARQVMEGRTLYSDFNRAPFIIAPYTPLYYAWTGLAGRLLGASPEGLFAVGRGTSLLAAALIGLLLWTGSRPERDQPIRSCLVLGAFFATPFVLAWAATARPDLPGLLFALAGILVWIKFEDRPWRFGSILLFLLAFLTKQSYLAAPAALLLHLAIQKKKGDSLLVGGLFAGGVAAVLLILHASTGGLSTLNILGSNLVPLSVANLRVVGGRFLQAAAFPLLLALAGLDRQRAKSLPFLYFAVALLWAFYASLKLGSDLNYFIEPLAAACLLIPFTLEALEGDRGGRLSAVMVVAGMLWAVPQINYRTNALETYRVEDEGRVRALVSEFDGLVLTDSPRLAYLSRSPFLIDPYQFASLQTAGKWDATPLLRMLEEGRVGLAVLRHPPESPSTWQGQPRLPRGVAEIVRARFERTGTLDGYQIYRFVAPKP